MHDHAHRSGLLLHVRLTLLIAILFALKISLTAVPTVYHCYGYGSKDADPQKTGAESQPQSAEPVATPVRNTKFDEPKEKQSSVVIDETPSVETTGCEPTTADVSKIPEVSADSKIPDVVADSKTPEPQQPDKVDPPLAEQAAVHDRKAMYLYNAMFSLVLYPSCF